MEIDPKLLTASGKKKLKKILTEWGPPNYSSLGCWSDFKKSEDYYKFQSEWNTHQVIREIFDGSGIEESVEEGLGWHPLTPREEAIYKNIANIIISLRNQIEDAAETAKGVSRRLDEV